MKRVNLFCYSLFLLIPLFFASCEKEDDGNKLLPSVITIKDSNGNDIETLTLEYDSQRRVTRAYYIQNELYKAEYLFTYSSQNRIEKVIQTMEYIITNLENQTYINTVTYDGDRVTYGGIPDLQIKINAQGNITEIFYSNTNNNLSTEYITTYEYNGQSRNLIKYSHSSSSIYIDASHDDYSRQYALTYSYDNRKGVYSGVNRFPGWLFDIQNLSLARRMPFCTGNNITGIKSDELDSYYKLEYEYNKEKYPVSFNYYYVYDDGIHEMSKRLEYSATIEYIEAN